MSGEEVSQGRVRSNLDFVAFLPFGAFLIFFHQGVPLRWISLASLLKAISLVSVCANLTRNDLLWAVFGLWAFLTVSIPLYINLGKRCKSGGVEKNSGNISLAHLFKMCSSSVFSDYKISLLAKIPLVIQVQAAGSIIYQLFGVDWVMHTLAGFGVGVAALKAYKTAVRYYGYSNLAAYFGLDRFKIFRVERKTGPMEFALFGISVAALIWEMIERIAYFVSPANILRIGPEPLWNVTGDVLFAFMGGIIGVIFVNRLTDWIDREQA